MSVILRNLSVFDKQVALKAKNALRLMYTLIIVNMLYSLDEWQLEKFQTKVTFKVTGNSAIERAHDFLLVFHCN